MIRAIVAFSGAVLTGLQIVLLVIGKEGICLNEGCKIVDGFPKLPPLYYNVAGCAFFLVLFWSFLKGRKGWGGWSQFCGVLLLAGIASEAVLLFFQYSIVGAFCSYCLIIFSFILLLNALSGLRQLFTASVIFAAVFVVLLSLNLKAVTGPGVSLESGSYARLGEGEGQPLLYLFFSETCPHCEKVIEAIEPDNKCTLRFNPVDRIEYFSLPGSSLFSGYDPEVNVGFLKNLEITEIPVLMAREQERTVILQGESRIIRYLTKHCFTGGETDYGGSSSASSSGYDYLLPQEKAEEGCSVEQECEDSGT
jgi:thiol-disulfide isomerase/thioredoxin